VRALGLTVPPQQRAELAESGGLDTGAPVAAPDVE
jgi:hypothetical protein